MPEWVFDYVCNPHSWPKWLAASHKIEGPDQPLLLGQIFREEWQIRRAMIELNWTVTDSNRPSTLTCQADTNSIGPIVIRYTFALEGGRARYTRELSNPNRPSGPSEEQLQRMDDEARTGLSNIKKHVEWRFAAHYVSPCDTEDHAIPHP